MLATSPLLTQCLREALQQTPDLIGHCVDDAVTRLKTEAGQGREVVVHDASSRIWWGLLQNKGLWIQAYTHLLGKAFAAGEQGQPVPDKALHLHTSRSELALEDEQAVNEWLQAARLLQELQSAVEQDLAALDARLSSLGGEVIVHVEDTPLRPSVFMGALRDLMAAVEPSPEVRSVWLQHMHPTLERELRGLYQHLALRLQQATEDPVNYRVRLVEPPAPTPTPRLHLLGDESGLSGTGDGAAVAPVAKARPSMPGMKSLACMQPGIDQATLLAFLQRGGAPFERPLSSVYHEQVGQALARLEARDAVPVLREVIENQQALPAVDRTARKVDVESSLSREDWGAFADPRERTRTVLALKLQAQTIAQAMGMVVVRRLVSQVASDPLLLAPVREAMVVLEPALLRLALAQPRFFSETEHPARRLVESVAQRSFKYNDEFSAEFGEFMQPVRQAYSLLNDAATQDSQVFADVLVALRDLWAKQDEREQGLRQERLRAMRFADERQALADHFTRELRQQTDLEGTPAFIVDFLGRIWSLVIASARLTQPDADDPGGYRAAVEQLLWCGRKEVVMRRPAQLFECLPELIQTLHRGLDVLGMSRTETQPFFDALMRLHEPVLGARRARVRHDGVASSPAPLPDASAALVLDETSPATSDQLQPREAEEPWLDHSELHAAGFEEAPPTDYGELDDTPEEPDDQRAVAWPGAALSEQDAEAMLDRLRVGDWIDLCSHGEWRRAQLIWASARGTLFMFTSDGGRAHSMSRRSCIKLIGRRWLRPVDTHAVVQSAIQAIAGEGGASPSGPLAPAG